jgi:hypothetical protein
MENPNTKVVDPTLADPEEDLVTLFMSTLPSMKYAFRDGHNAVFIQSRFFTENKQHEEELLKEVKSGHPYIYINPKEPKVNPKFQDPLSRLKIKHIQEFLTLLSKATNGDNVVPNTPEGANRLTPASTSDIAAVVAGGDATSLQQRIAAMVNAVKVER